MLVHTQPSKPPCQPAKPPICSHRRTSCSEGLHNTLRPAAGHSATPLSTQIHLCGCYGAAQVATPGSSSSSCDPCNDPSIGSYGAYSSCSPPPAGKLTCWEVPRLGNLPQAGRATYHVSAGSGQTGHMQSKRWVTPARDTGACTQGPKGVAKHLQQPRASTALPRQYATDLQRVFQVEMLLRMQAAEVGTQVA
jgi:hypothetical protein